MDIVAACAENGNGSITVSNLGNCNATSVTTPGGQVTLNRPASVTCGADGTVPNGTAVNATLAGVTDYISVCTIGNNGIRCTVQSQ